MIKKLITMTALATVLTTGCTLPKIISNLGRSPYEERPFEIKVETLPSGYLIGISTNPNPQDDQIKVIGATEANSATGLNFWGFSVVKRRFSNGTENYWLRNNSGVFPNNKHKPQWASDEYDAGRSYPYKVYIMVLRELKDETLARLPQAELELNEPILRMIFENEVKKVVVTLDINDEYSTVHYSGGVKK